MSSFTLCLSSVLHDWAMILKQNIIVRLFFSLALNKYGISLCYHKLLTIFLFTFSPPLKRFFFLSFSHFLTHSLSWTYFSHIGTRNKPLLQLLLSNYLLNVGSLDYFHFEPLSIWSFECKVSPFCLFVFYLCSILFFFALWIHKKCRRKIEKKSFNGFFSLTRCINCEQEKPVSFLKITPPFPKYRIRLCAWFVIHSDSCSRS